jgi:hypothetical protein
VPDCWLLPDVEVRPSEIAGRGWFAKVDLPAGTVVCRIDPIELDEEHQLVPPAAGQVGLGNHSCDPNLGWVDEHSLETLTDVSSGEELVIDYAMAIADPDWFLRCHCPSYRCRQMIEGTDWMIPQLQERYAGHWAPHVQRLVDERRGPR